MYRLLYKNLTEWSISAVYLSLGIRGAADLVPHAFLSSSSCTVFHWTARRESNWEFISDTLVGCRCVFAFQAVLASPVSLQGRFIIKNRKREIEWHYIEAENLQKHLRCMSWGKAAGAVPSVADPQNLYRVNGAVDGITLPSKGKWWDETAKREGNPLRLKFLRDFVL